VRAVGYYPHNSELHRYAFRALEKFLVSNPSLKKAVPMHAAAKAIVDSVFHHIGDAGLQGYAGKLLRALEFEDAFAARKWVTTQQQQMKRSGGKTKAQQQQQPLQTQQQQQLQLLSETPQQKQQRLRAEKLEAEALALRLSQIHPTRKPMPTTYQEARALEKAMVKAQHLTARRDQRMAQGGAHLPSVLSPKRLDDPLEYFSPQNNGQITMKHEPLPPPKERAPAEAPVPTGGSFIPEFTKHFAKPQAKPQPKPLSEQDLVLRQQVPLIPEFTKDAARPLSKQDLDVRKQDLDAHQRESLSWLSSVVPLSKGWTAKQVELVRPLVGQLSHKEKKDPFGAATAFFD
jgi:hypothetical protein